MNVSKLSIISLSILTISCFEGIESPGNNSGNQSQLSVTIVGIVRDALTDSTIEGATISSDNDQSSISLPDGSYTLKIQPGIRTLSTTADGFAVSEKVFNCEADSQYTIDFDLTRPLAKLWGGVFYSDWPSPPTPIANATIICAEKLTFTNNEGAYELEIPGGSHLVRISAQGYRSTTEGITISQGQTLLHNFFLYMP